MALPRENRRIFIQADWDKVLRERAESAWIGFRKQGQSSVYGKINSQGVDSNGNPDVSATDGFRVNEITRKSINVTYNAQDGPCFCRFVAPQLTLTTVHKSKKSVIGLDVSEGGLAVSSDTEGRLLIWTTHNGEVRRELKGHYLDVYCCRFFPSGVVVLSGGADTQVKIWSAETGECAATLTGHKAGIQETAIVDRGRNVVSCSRDGTVKLWDVGQKGCLSTFDSIEGGMINSCCLGTPDGLELSQGDHPASDREVQTEGKLLLVACENSTLQGWSLHGRSKVFSAQCSDAVNCCTFLSSTTVACGTQDSNIYCFDLRNTSIPLLHLKESRGAILSMLPYKQGLFVTTNDGSCCYIDEEQEIRLELTGSDCDPIYRVVHDGNYLYTSCRDGYIRRYIL